VFDAQGMAEGGLFLAGADMENLLNRKAMTTIIVAAVYLVLFFWVDRAADIWIHDHYANTWVFRLGTSISYLAQGTYIKLLIAVGLIVIFVCDPDLKQPWSRKLLYVCVSVALAIIIGDALKYLLGRHRPIMLFEHNLYGLHGFSSEWDLNSTPSGHTLRAFALLTALSLLYRRFTVVFMAAAVLIGASRVAVTAHYPSDVVLGAFIGIFAAAWTYETLFAKTMKGQPRPLT
jgi:membrane-associated phospholipid phosphatase